MESRYRLLRRNARGGTYYCVDTRTGKRTRKRTSLGKLTKREAQDVLHAKNQAERQPTLNLQAAKAYLKTRREAMSSKEQADSEKPVEGVSPSKGSVRALVQIFGFRS